MLFRSSCVVDRSPARSRVVDASRASFRFGAEVCGSESATSKDGDRWSGRSRACEASRVIVLAERAPVVCSVPGPGGPARRKSASSRLAEYPSSSLLVTVADLGTWRIRPEASRSRGPPSRGRPPATAPSIETDLVAIGSPSPSSQTGDENESPGPLERKKSARSIAADCPRRSADVAAGRGSARGRGLEMRGVCERSVVHPDLSVDVVDVRLCACRVEGERKSP